MRLALAIGVATIGLAFSALAHEMPRIDANNDGWVTRAEASAVAEDMFRHLDSNHDNKLDTADHGPDQLFEVHIDDGDGEVVEETESHHEDGARHERRVIIRRGPGDGPIPPDPAMAPMPPHPPMAMMMIAHSEEADLNNDGAMSLDEFRAQHLRFFDAGDVNGDGRIRFSEPPAPPAPPEAPHAPAPPAHHH